MSADLSRTLHTTPARNTRSRAAGAGTRLPGSLSYCAGPALLQQQSLTAGPCQRLCLCSAPARQQRDLDAALQTALKHVVRGAHARIVCESDAVREHARHVRRARLQARSSSRLSLRGSGGAGQAERGVGGHRRG